MIVVYEKDYYDEVTGNAVFTADSKIESMRWRNKIADIMDECNDDILAYLSLRNMVIDEETKLGIQRIMDGCMIKLNELSKKTVDNYENLYINIYYDYTHFETLIRLLYIDTDEKIN